MAFNVGEIVATLRLDKKGWKRSIKKVKKDIKKLEKYCKKNGVVEVDLPLNIIVNGKRR